MQRSFSELEYAQKKKRTRRDRFFQELDAVVPWSALEQVIMPFYPTTGRRGRPPIGLTRMLRMYVAQQCFGLSDEGIEDAIYDSQAIRGFVGIDLSRESAPDATTLLDFRHLLEQHQLTESIFNAIAYHLAAKGLLLREGTIVDATLIAAPPSTKNKEGKRDPEMHQSKKGNQWHFGMKAHIGVDAHSGLVHTVIGTAGNVSDISQAQALLHGEEQAAFGDAGYQGIEKRPESAGATFTPTPCGGTTTWAACASGRSRPSGLTPATRSWPASRPTPGRWKAAARNAATSACAGATPACAPSSSPATPGLLTPAAT